MEALYKDVVRNVSRVGKTIHKLFIMVVGVTMLGELSQGLQWWGILITQELFEQMNIAGKL